MTSKIKLGNRILSDEKLYLGNIKVEKIYQGDGNLLYQTQWPGWILITTFPKYEENLDFYLYDEYVYIGEVRYNGIYYPIYTPENYNENVHPYLYFLILTPRNEIELNSSDIFENQYNGNIDDFIEALNREELEAKNMLVDGIFLNSDKTTVFYTLSDVQDFRTVIILSGDF